jgi:hypothetical protein
MGERHGNLSRLSYYALPQLVTIKTSPKIEKKLDGFSGVVTIGREERT